MDKSLTKSEYIEFVNKIHRKLEEIDKYHIEEQDTLQNKLYDKRVVDEQQQL